MLKGKVKKAYKHSVSQDFTIGAVKPQLGMPKRVIQGAVKPQLGMAKRVIQGLLMFASLHIVS